MDAMGNVKPGTGSCPCRLVSINCRIKKENHRPGRLFCPGMCTTLCSASVALYSGGPSEEIQAYPLPWVYSKCQDFVADKMKKCRAVSQRRFGFCFGCLQEQCFVIHRDQVPTARTSENF